MDTFIGELQKGSPINTIRLHENKAYEDQQTIENTLMSVLFWNAKVVRIQLPSGMLDQYQMKRMHLSINSIVGDSGCTRVYTTDATRRHEVYLVDAAVYPAVSRRFRPGASASYTEDDFEILVSPCKGIVELPNAKILIVKKGAFGVHGRQGWMRRSMGLTLYEEAFDWRLESFDHDPFCQFVMAFNQTQAAGAFKLMPDNVADLLDADLILSEDSVTPIDETTMIEPFESQRSLRGRVLLGITEVPGYFETAASTILGRLPASAIANDSFVLLNEEGILCFGSGWLPVDSAIGPRGGELFSQYRLMPDELWKAKYLEEEGISDLLIDQQENCFTTSEFELILRQFRLEATCVLHPETAEKVYRQLA